LAPPRIDFLFFDAGGGHRSAATALEVIITQQQRPWDVRLVDMNDVMAKTDIFKKLTGYGLEDIYNLALERGWTWGSTHLLKLMQWFIRMFHAQEVRLIEQFWRSNPPDAVVSVIPHFNRAIFEALRKVTATAPYVTIITDFADYPPNFWIVPGQRQYIISGTKKGVDQALAMGHPKDRVFGTSGMILRPSFYDVPSIDRSAERRILGLDPALPTGLILFGGFGAPVMERIVESLQGMAGRLQLILMCGHNEKLAEKLKSHRGNLRLHVEGFTREVPRFMQMSDFMVGKPGPGSVSEAIHMGLPVIVERNSWTMPQERYNAEWLEEHGVGFVLSTFRDIRGAIDKLLTPGELEKYRQRAAQIQNRAIFEIPDLLQQVLERGA
jgi:1,2-diacylglycerol 3-beta-galactosyltransferase